MDLEESTPLFGLSVDTSIANLRETAKWARFLAIVGFIGVGLMIIILLFMLLFNYGTSSVSAEYPGLQQSVVWGSRIGVLIVLIFTALYVIPLVFLFRFGTRMRDAIAANDQTSLDVAFQNLKSLFRFIGILTIIVLSIYALMFVLMLLFGMSAGL